MRFKREHVLSLGKIDLVEASLGRRKKRWDVIFIRAMELTKDGELGVQQNELASLLKDWYEKTFGEISTAAIKKRLKKYREIGLIK